MDRDVEDLVDQYDGTARGPAIDFDAVWLQDLDDPGPLADDLDEDWEQQ